MEVQQLQIFDYIDTDPQELEPPELPPIVREGELWQLGDHRLMCGDSTDPETDSALREGYQNKQQRGRARAGLFRRQRIHSDRCTSAAPRLLYLRAAAELVRRYYKTLANYHGQAGAKNTIKHKERGSCGLPLSYV